MTVKKRARKSDPAGDFMEPKDDLEEIAENAGRYARKIFDETGHAGEAADRIADAIRAEPVKSALIALGVGAVIGMLLKRGS